MDTQPQTNITTQQVPSQPLQQSPTPVVTPIPAKKRLSKPLIILGSIAIVLIVGAGTALALKLANTSAPVASTQPVTTTKKPATAPATTTTDAALQTDITNLDTSSSLDTTNLSTTDSNLNDQQQQVAVPTN
jgi:hypothetical protein